MSDIFISYKREDVPLAKSLAELLTEKVGPFGGIIIFLQVKNILIYL